MPNRTALCRWLASLLLFAFGLIAALLAAEAPSGRLHPLVWDSMEKVLAPKPGERVAPFQFTVTNVSDKPVAIETIRPTCDCTVAEVPASPWVIAPGASGTFTGVFDLRQYEGTVTKAVFVVSPAGTQRLLVTVKVPGPDMEKRRKDQAVARADRQAVLRGDCAGCHVAPAAGRKGGELFTSACGVCHLAKQRAPEVPNLLVARQHRDAAFWRKWISEGKEGTMMPAWSQERGGPLTTEQVESLVQFALEKLPTEPRE